MILIKVAKLIFNDVNFVIIILIIILLHCGIIQMMKKDNVVKVGTGVVI